MTNINAQTKINIIGKRIPSIGPSITKKEIDLVTEAVSTGWYENMNKYIDQFTKEFTGYLGVKYCFPVSHGTAAIHLALLAIGVGPGDEVIVPDITWVASAAPISYVGANIVFADIDPLNLCLSPKSFEKAITKKTKAVVVVDLLGNMPEWTEIKRIAKKHNIYIIEDAAEAIGAEYKERKAGTFGDIGVFSFNATKLTNAGQGGVITTNKKYFFEKCKLYSHHGINKKPGAKYYWSNVIGYNYNWTNIQAALGLAQLGRLEELLQKKKEIFNWYQKNLKDVKGVWLNTTSKHVKNTYWLINIILDKPYKIKKEIIQKEFIKYNIDARPFFYPISSMPPYKKYCKNKNIIKLNPNSYNISPYGISLPSGINLTETDVKYVCDCFIEILYGLRGNKNE